MYDLFRGLCSLHVGVDYTSLHHNVLIVIFVKVITLTFSFVNTDNNMIPAGNKKAYENSSG